MSHHRYRNGKSSIGRARKVYGRRLYDLGYLQVFAKLPIQARGAVLVPDVLVVWDTCEEMVAACRDVRAFGPLLPLQGHVTLFLFLLQVAEQDGHAVARGVLKGQRDEDESHTEVSEVVPVIGSFSLCHLNEDE